MEDPYPTGKYPDSKVWFCVLFSCLSVTFSGITDTKSRCQTDSLASLPTWEKIDFGRSPKIGKISPKNGFGLAGKTGKKSPKNGILGNLGAIFPFLGPFFPICQVKPKSIFGRYFPILGGGPRSIFSQVGRLARLISNTKADQ